METKKEKFEDYEGFVEKFKLKKTTDDCYTPQYVYDEIFSWFNENIQSLDGCNIVRPFWPGADYKALEYHEDDVVFDNPPFSIFAQIIDYYTAKGIKFFLFAPSLTLFSAFRPNVTYIVAHCDIKYENGAVVRTSFVTNMERRHRVILAGDLYKQVKAATERMQKQDKKSRRAIIYPDNLISGATLGRLAVRGICMKIPMAECEFVRKLDNAQGTVFGGGYLLAERAAAERIELSPREKAIIESLGK